MATAASVDTTNLTHYVSTLTNVQSDIRYILCRFRYESADADTVPDQLVLRPTANDLTAVGVIEGDIRSAPDGNGTLGLEVDAVPVSTTVTDYVVYLKSASAGDINDTYNLLIIEEDGAELASPPTNLSTLPVTDVTYDIHSGVDVYAASTGGSVIADSTTETVYDDRSTIASETLALKSYYVEGGTQNGSGDPYYVTVIESDSDYLRDVLEIVYDTTVDSREKFDLRVRAGADTTSLRSGTKSLVIVFQDASGRVHNLPTSFRVLEEPSLSVVGVADSGGEVTGTGGYQAYIDTDSNKSAFTVRRLNGPCAADGSTGTGTFTLVAESGQSFVAVYDSSGATFALTSHGYLDGDVITVSSTSGAYDGSTATSYDGTFSVTNASANSFQLRNTSTDVILVDVGDTTGGVVRENFSIGSTSADLIVDSVTDSGSGANFTTTANHGFSSDDAVVLSQGTAVRQITTVTPQSGTAANYENEYVTLYLQGGVGVSYWFSNSSSPASAPSGTATTAFEVDVTGLTTAAAVAEALRDIINEPTNPRYFEAVLQPSAALEVTNVDAGDVRAATTSDAGVAAVANSTAGDNGYNVGGYVDVVGSATTFTVDYKDSNDADEQLAYNADQSANSRCCAATAVAVTGITDPSSGATASFNTSSAHGLVTGMQCIIGQDVAEANNANLPNARGVVTVIDSDSFSIAVNGITIPYTDADATDLTTEALTVFVEDVKATISIRGEMDANADQTEPKLIAASRIQYTENSTDFNPSSGSGVFVYDGIAITSVVLNVAESDKDEDVWMTGRALTGVAEVDSSGALHTTSSHALHNGQVVIRTLFDANNVGGAVVVVNDDDFRITQADGVTVPYSAGDDSGTITHATALTVTSVADGSSDAQFVCASHGLSAGDVVVLGNNFGHASYDDIVGTVAAVVDANTFEVDNGGTIAYHADAAGGGTVYTPQVKAIGVQNADLSNGITLTVSFTGGFGTVTSAAGDFAMEAVTDSGSVSWTDPNDEPAVYSSTEAGVDAGSDSTITITLTTTGADSDTDLATYLAAAALGSTRYRTVAPRVQITSDGNGSATGLYYSTKYLAVYTTLAANANVDTTRHLAYNADTGVAEISTATVSFTTDENDIQSNYILYTLADEVKHYFWFDVNSGGTDPAVSGATAHEVNISSGASVNDVAAALATAIDAVTGFGASDSGAVVTVTLDDKATVANPSTDDSTHLTLAVTTKGRADASSGTEILGGSSTLKAIFKGGVNAMTISSAADVAATGSTLTLDTSNLGVDVDTLPTAPAEYDLADITITDSAGNTVTLPSVTVDWYSPMTLSFDSLSNNINLESALDEADGTLPVAGNTTYGFFNLQMDVAGGHPDDNSGTSPYRDPPSKVEVETPSSDGYVEIPFDSGSSGAMTTALGLLEDKYQMAWDWNDSTAGTNTSAYIRVYLMNDNSGEVYATTNAYNIRVTFPAGPTLESGSTDVETGLAWQETVLSAVTFSFSDLGWNGGAGTDEMLINFIDEPTSTTGYTITAIATSGDAATALDPSTANKVNITLSSAGHGLAAGDSVTVTSATSLPNSDFYIEAVASDVLTLDLDWDTSYDDTVDGTATRTSDGDPLAAYYTMPSVSLDHTTFWNDPMTVTGVDASSNAVKLAIVDVSLPADGSVTNVTAGTEDTDSARDYALFTATNTLAAGDHVRLFGFTAASGVSQYNNVQGRVRSANLSSSQFELEGAFFDADTTESADTSGSFQYLHHAASVTTALNIGSGSQSAVWSNIDANASKRFRWHLESGDAHQPYRVAMSSVTSGLFTTSINHNLAAGDEVTFLGAITGTTYRVISTNLAATTFRVVLASDQTAYTGSDSVTFVQTPLAILYDDGEDVANARNYDISSNPDLVVRRTTNTQVYASIDDNGGNARITTKTDSGHGTDLTSHLAEGDHIIVTSVDTGSTAYPAEYILGTASGDTFPLLHLDGTAVTYVSDKNTSVQEVTPTNVESVIVLVDNDNSTNSSGSIQSAFYRVARYVSVADVSGFTLARDPDQSWPDCSSLQVSSVLDASGGAVTTNLDYQLNYRLGNEPATVWHDTAISGSSATVAQITTALQHLPERFVTDVTRLNTTRTASQAKQIIYQLGLRNGIRAESQFNYEILPVGRSYDFASTSSTPPRGVALGTQIRRVCTDDFKSEVLVGVYRHAWLPNDLYSFSRVIERTDVYGSGEAAEDVE